MELFIVDAFTDFPFGGNPAGVAICRDALPEEAEMRATAAKVGFSETAFVLPLADGTFQLRYFTPVEEVSLCGHATVGTFSLLLERREISEGRRYIAHTGAGDIEIDVRGGLVWLDMAPPRELFILDEAQTQELLALYGLPADACGALRPAVVDAGLPDIMLPLKNRALLAAMMPRFEGIAALSKRLNVTGVHAFAFWDREEESAPNITGYCRNFAPLYGIDEEAATGTSNGALTYYLYRRGIIRPNDTNLFIQGEAMGKPSKIYTELTLDAAGAAKIRVGGRGVVRK